MRRSKEPDFSPNLGQRFAAWLPKSFGDRLHLGIEEVHERGDGSTFVRSSRLVIMWETETTIWRLCSIPIRGAVLIMEAVDMEALMGVPDGELGWIEDEWGLDGED